MDQAWRHVARHGDAEGHGGHQLSAGELFGEDRWPPGADAPAFSGFLSVTESQQKIWAEARITQFEDV